MGTETGDGHGVKCTEAMAHPLGSNVISFSTITV